MSEPDTSDPINVFEQTWREEANALEAPDVTEALIASMHVTLQEDARAERDAVWAIAAAVAICSVSWLLAWYTSQGIEGLMIALPN